MNTVLLRPFLLLGIVALLLPSGVQAQADALPTIEAKTADMQKLDGYMPLYWHERTGKLWLEISRFDQEILYANGLTAGLGSNDIGLDRGQSSGSRIVVFERIGPKVLMVQPNYSFRAVSDNPDEVRAVEDAFARSVLWGFEAAAESSERVLVDATDFFVRDASGTGPRLGNYDVDKSRSAIHLPQTRVFEQNTEVDVTLTFVRRRQEAGRGNARGPTEGPTPVGRDLSAAPGRGFGRNLFSGTVASVSPNAAAVTLRQHHSFVELPGPGYTPRAIDPRAGYFGMMVQDYAVPLGETLSQRWLSRHRLEKTDPTARDQRRRRADRLLPRSRHPRAYALGAARGRQLVGRGLRSGGLSQRLSGGASAGGR